jgi:hypothetical protein
VVSAVQCSTVQAFCLLVGGGGAVVELMDEKGMEWDRMTETATEDENDDENDDGEGIIRSEAE